MKMDALSVNLSEILARCQKKKKIRTMHDGADFHHYSVAYGLMSARFHTLPVKHTLDCTPCNHEDIGLVNGFIGLGLDLD